MDNIACTCVLNKLKQGRLTKERKLTLISNKTFKHTGEVDNLNKKFPAQNKILIQEETINSTTPELITQISESKIITMKSVIMLALVGWASVWAIPLPPNQSTDFLYTEMDTLRSIVLEQRDKIADLENFVYSVADGLEQNTNVIIKFTDYLEKVDQRADANTPEVHTEDFIPQLKRVIPGGWTKEGQVDGQVEEEQEEEYEHGSEAQNETENEENVEEVEEEAEKEEEEEEEMNGYMEAESEEEETEEEEQQEQEEEKLEEEEEPEQEQVEEKEEFENFVE